MSGRSQAIADVLMRAILDRRLLPGSKLGERELSELFRVSRIVVRQALIRLADADLVRIERNRGAFVARPSIQEALEIYDALTAIEQGIAARLSETLSTAGWNELRQQVERQRHAVASSNPELADLLGEEFHMLLVRLSRNTVMQEIHGQLLRRTALLRSLVPASFDYTCLIDEHEQIVDLLKRRRVKQAIDLIAAHYRHVVGGYILETSDTNGSSAREALLPYVHPAGASGRNADRSAPMAAQKPRRSKSGKTEKGRQPARKPAPAATGRHRRS